MTASWPRIAKFAIIGIAGVVAAAMMIAAWSGPRVYDPASVELLVDDEKLPACATNVRMYEDHNPLGASQLVSFECPVGEARKFSELVLGEPLRAGEDPGVEFQSHGQGWWIKEFPPEAEGGSGWWYSVGIEVTLVPAGQKATVWMVLQGT